jgi:hypothetical protein
MGDGDKGIEIVYKEEQLSNIKPPKEGFISFVLFESPFTPVSTVGRGHPSLASLELENINCLGKYSSNLIVDPSHIYNDSVHETSILISILAL